jgi:hypothetical protein
MIHKNKTFEDETILLDGETFENCKFIRCRLSYAGGQQPAMLNCDFVPQTWQFTGAATNTISFLAKIASLTRDGALRFEAFMNAIQGKPQEIIPTGENEQIESLQETKYTFDNLGAHLTHASMVAKIAALFAIIEFQLCQVFAWMLQCYPMHAAASYYRLQNNKARIDMLKGLLTYLHSDDERVVVQTIIDGAQEAARIRNIYCHALWKSEGDKLYLIENLETRYPHGTKRLISVATIISEAAQVEKHQREIATAFGALTQKRGLVLAPEAVKPTYARKFLSQSSRPRQEDDPTPQSKSEVPAPPSQSSGE